MPYKRLGESYNKLGIPIGSPRGASSAEAFSPASLNPLLWLDGSDLSTLFVDSLKTTPVTADNDLVGAWVDKSGNGNDALQTTGGNKPVYKTAIQNSKSILRFDGLASCMDLSGMTNVASNYTIFAVTEKASVTADKWLFDIQTGRLLGTLQTGSGAYFDPSGFQGANIMGTDPQSVAWQLDSSNAKIRQDGVQTQTGLSYTQSAIGGSMAIGAKFDCSANFYDGDIMEFLILPLLGASDISSMETYLNNKWALY